MYGLGLGVANIGESLPQVVFALLSGLNAATVGIIVLAAVQLSEKAITDNVTRVLVFFGAAAGIMYNALWYFPLLITLAGLVTVVHDFRWLHSPIKAITTRLRRPTQAPDASQGVELQVTQVHAISSSQTAPDGHRSASLDSNRGQVLPVTEDHPIQTEERVVPQGRRLNIGWKFGLAVIFTFLACFIIVMVIRGALPNKPLLYSLFANMFLAGTIIFGGGPVVIPLLREYIVAEGWVSPRDFLIGLAIIQAFPGPNFNFAVYLGTLTAVNAGHSSASGALLGFLGIFVPGLTLVHGTMGIWTAIRGLRWVKSALRGVNSAAVGLIYTAVYRIWQVGYIDDGFQQGKSLGAEPWWVVVTATSYVGGYWFNVSPPVVIVVGAVMGLVWYGVIAS